MGIGILGALFNVVTMPKLAALESAGITPAKLLDPHLRSQLSPNVLHSAGWMIEAGLRWVFIGMLCVAVLQLFVSRLMPTHEVRTHSFNKSEIAEAVIG